MLKWIFFIAGILFECTALALSMKGQWGLCIFSIMVGFAFMQPALIYCSNNSQSNSKNEEN